ncbi:4Fe-4S dicluster domain-containing protein [Desulfallas thermosapovorans]|uniref:Fe-S-cluster-containing dehydrogenase component n=1 Tax=Desulfallas thermosapovorans DSM 6562 TaxID=1121431 RepID=A0A5S4ZRD8_9FIRM|nr:4Fe-4S dicluster domain-containing protein [Desulfallas thermosapovorans]TYO95373.1 Fe-S-cluster-containing dehydrogenase component [Desulfallas thermosapovorans DSM 6562]
MSKGVLVDITRCVGCGSCAVACKMWNSLQYNNGVDTVGENAELAAEEWTVVKKAVVKKEQKTAWRFVKQQCLHCLEPACASACFSRAIQKTKEGPVVYVEELCVGCRYCMLACPYNIPKYEWDKTFPRVRKCQMCASRVSNGEAPACVGVCPSGALTFGDRAELLQLARERISSGGYINHIYGEDEAGGTNWLYIADVPFEELGFRTGITTKPLPEYSESILRLTPAVGLGWGAVLTGLYVYNRRRNEVAREEKISSVKKGKKK